MCKTFVILDTCESRRSRVTYFRWEEVNNILHPSQFIRPSRLSMWSIEYKSFNPKIILLESITTEVFYDIYLMLTW
jgi:hypothetical protein